MKIVPTCLQERYNCSAFYIKHMFEISGSKLFVDRQYKRVTLIAQSPATAYMSTKGIRTGHCGCVPYLSY